MTHGGGAIRIPLPADSWAARVARSEAGRALEALLWDHRVADVLLIVSELVTNAVEQKVAAIELVLEVNGRTLRIEVCDSGGGRPVVRSSGPGETRGRGLNIVAGVSDAWGSDVAHGRTVVWSEIRR